MKDPVHLQPGQQLTLRSPKDYFNAPHYSFNYDVVNGRAARSIILDDVNNYKPNSTSQMELRTQPAIEITPCPNGYIIKDINLSKSIVLTLAELEAALKFAKKDVRDKANAARKLERKKKQELVARLKLTQKHATQTYADARDQLKQLARS